MPCGTQLKPALPMRRQTNPGAHAPSPTGLHATPQKRSVPSCRQMQRSPTPPQGTQVLLKALQVAHLTIEVHQCGRPHDAKVVAASLAAAPEA
jgi:hypothetical protein